MHNATNRVERGAVIDVAIKGVILDAVDSIGPKESRVTILDEHGDAYVMPPQAAITLAALGGGPGQEESRIAKILDLLDSMEAEGCLDPHVARTVRKVAGLPPRHWPPRPGDVWTDEIFPSSMRPFWFAQLVHDDGRDDLVMVPVVDGCGVKTPQGLLEESVELRLVYRGDGEAE